MCAVQLEKPDQKAHARLIRQFRFSAETHELDRSTNLEMQRPRQRRDHPVRQDARVASGHHANDAWHQLKPIRVLPAAERERIPMLWPHQALEATADSFDAWIC
jgi:hypothetical protein